MIAPKDFVDGLLEMGYDYFACVPCSYFGPLLTELASREGLDFQIASVEAEAIAIAAGAAMGGRIPLVMLQNSGLGNCVNPVSSLLTPFKVPLVLLVSHRGLDEADRKAPQHDMMGKITYGLLDLLSIPWQTMALESSEALAMFAKALKDAKANQGPQAIVLEGKPFLKGLAEPDYNVARPSRLEAMRAVSAGLEATTLVIASTGMVSRDLQAVGDREGNFYMVGSMGLASSIALGVASGINKKVVVIDGDGSCLMRLGSLPTIGRYKPSNLLHLVLDNNSHSSTGGQQTASSNIDFPGLALSCGYCSAKDVESLQDLTKAIKGFEVGQGPRLLHFKIRSGNQPNPARVSRTLFQVREDFSRAVSDA